MVKFSTADRIAKLPPYLFAEIDKVKNEVKKRGVDIISLGIGDPDTPTPEFIIEAMKQSLENPVNHQYPSYVGLLSYRKAVADWYSERFSVALDPEEEVVSLIGSKEGIAHFPLAFVNPGDVVLVATPNYPVYPNAVYFAGGKVEFVPLTEDNSYLPDLDAVSEESRKAAKMFFVNYPNNPTSATASKAFYEKLVQFGLENDIIIVHDAAYTEMYYDDGDKPMSILEIPEAKETSIEFHSLSKTYNMTGWRVGMAVGNKELVAGLGKIKENIDSGIFQAVQEAGIVALREGEPFAQSMRDLYKDRRDLTVAALRDNGIDCMEPKATFYLWSKIPSEFKSSTEFASTLLQETGVVVTPGNGFGAPGEGYFRISLSLGNDRLKEAVARIAKM